MAHTKILNQRRLSTHIHQAYLRYRELCKGKEADLSDVRKFSLATRAAHDNGLSYNDGEIEPLIITALFALANPGKTEKERAEALSEAWDAYNENWRTLH